MSVFKRQAHQEGPAMAVTNEVFGEW